MLAAFACQHGVSCAAHSVLPASCLHSSKLLLCPSISAAAVRLLQAGGAGAARPVHLERAQPHPGVRHFATLVGRCLVHWNGRQARYIRHVKLLCVAVRSGVRVRIEPAPRCYTSTRSNHCRAATPQHVPTTAVLLLLNTAGLVQLFGADRKGHGAGAGSKQAGKRVCSTARQLAGWLGGGRRPRVQCSSPALPTSPRSPSHPLHVPPLDGWRFDHMLCSSPKRAALLSVSHQLPLLFLFACAAGRLAV